MRNFSSPSILQSTWQSVIVVDDAHFHTAQRTPHFFALTVPHGVLAHSKQLREKGRVSEGMSTWENDESQKLQKKQECSKREGKRVRPD